MMVFPVAVYLQAVACLGGSQSETVLGNVVDLCQCDY